MLDSLRPVVIEAENMLCHFILIEIRDRNHCVHHFIRGNNWNTHTHLKIFNNFREEVGCDIPMTILGGACIAILPKDEREQFGQKTVYLTLSSNQVGRVRDRATLLRLLQFEFPDAFIDHRQLE